MSRLTLVKHAIRLYRYDLSPRHTQRHNVRAWLASVDMLGPRRLLANPIKREVTNG